MGFLETRNTLLEMYYDIRDTERREALKKAISVMEIVIDDVGDETTPVYMSDYE